MLGVYVLTVRKLGSAACGLNGEANAFASDGGGRGGGRVAWDQAQVCLQKLKMETKNHGIFLLLKMYTRCTL